MSRAVPTAHGAFVIKRFDLAAALDESGLEVLFGCPGLTDSPSSPRARELGRPGAGPGPRLAGTQTRADTIAVWTVPCIASISPTRARRA